MPMNNPDPKGSPKLPAGNSVKQLRAATVAKESQIKEAGLGGNRTGKSSASGKRDQAHRDAASETLPETPDPTHTPDASSEADRLDERSVHVQVNTDHHIHGSQRLHQNVQDTVNASLDRFGRHVTRFEVHLSDVNAGKSHSDDKRCVLEARPAGHQPLVVTHLAATIDDAVDGAVGMMEKLLDRTFHKLHDPKGRTPLGETAR